MGQLERRDASRALQSARDIRADLRGAIGDCESALAAPAVGDTLAWAHNLEKQVMRLQDAFAAHIDVVEGTNGLHDEILAAAPRVAPAVKRLSDEHDTISRSIRDAIAFLHSDGPILVDTSRETVLQLLGMLARHRQRGADVVYEAYAVDIGGE